MEDKKLKTSKLFYSVIAVVLFFIIVAAVYLFVFEKSPNNTIKIGEIQTYSQLTSFTFPYRNGWQLALEEINKAGGVMGSKIEVISRDDQGKPGEAVKIRKDC
jgi:branched-chain amino acid transport system substrate-binding protein